MKRFGNIFDEICTIDNLKLADIRACRGKSSRLDIQAHILNREDNLQNLRHLLVNNEFKTSEYSRFIIKEPKEREIFRLPYYPDRIVHHAIMNKLESIFINSFIANTFNCIKGRGIISAHRKLFKSLQDLDYKYCLKFDICKFYPSINHEILKKLLNKKFKDKKLLSLLYNIIDSAEGLPIGNYLSQYLANFYLNGFDHWIKETLKIKYYFRYCDDIVILGKTKKELWYIFNQIRTYLSTNLKLTIKSNYQVFPINIRGIDFLGYVFYRDYILLRKSIKKNFIKMIKWYPNPESINSYGGWLTHCNSINLKNKYLCQIK